MLLDESADDKADHLRRNVGRSTRCQDVLPWFVLACFLFFGAIVSECGIDLKDVPIGVAVVEVAAEAAQAWRDLISAGLEGEIAGRLWARRCQSQDLNGDVRDWEEPCRGSGRESE